MIGDDQRRVGAVERFLERARRDAQLANDIGSHEEVVADEVELRLAEYIQHRNDGAPRMSSVGGQPL
jgi:hypothetical protein